jgi:hypothetical protein
VDRAITAIAVSEATGDVYVGGVFTEAGGASGTGRIARWNGRGWFGLGGGVSMSVNAIAISGSDIYAGGAFKEAGGLPISFVARWDGTSWSALGSGLSGIGGYGFVKALAVSGSVLYAGGNFTVAGASPAINIAAWDGTSWSTLGGGVKKTEKAIAHS